MFIIISLWDLSVDFFFNKLIIRNWFKYNLFLRFLWNPKETWVTLCLFKKKKCNIKQCFRTVNQDFQEVDDERGSLQTGSGSDMKGWAAGVSPVYLFFCVVFDVLMTQEMAQDGSLVKSSSHTYRESCYSAVYIYSTEAQVSRKVSPCSVHRFWSKIAQVGHLKSHYVCTDTLIVRSAGVYKILWP